MTIKITEKKYRNGRVLVTAEINQSGFKRERSSSSMTYSLKKAMAVWLNDYWKEKYQCLTPY